MVLQKTGIKSFARLTNTLIQQIQQNNFITESSQKSKILVVLVTNTSYAKARSKERYASMTSDVPELEQEHNNALKVFKYLGVDDENIKSYFNASW